MTLVASTNMGQFRGHNISTQEEEQNSELREIHQKTIIPVLEKIVYEYLLPVNPQNPTIGELHGLVVYNEFRNGNVDFQEFNGLRHYRRIYDNSETLDFRSAQYAYLRKVTIVYVRTLMHLVNEHSSKLCSDFHGVTGVIDLIEKYYHPSNPPTLKQLEDLIIYRYIKNESLNIRLRLYEQPFRIDIYLNENMHHSVIDIPELEEKLNRWNNPITKEEIAYLYQLTSLLSEACSYLFRFSMRKGSLEITLRGKIIHIVSFQEARSSIIQFFKSRIDIKKLVEDHNRLRHILTIPEFDVDYLNQNNVLFQAVQCGYVESVELLLQVKGIDINKKAQTLDYGKRVYFSPLREAIRSGKVEIVRLLTAMKGIKVNEEVTLLHQAVSLADDSYYNQRAEEIIKVLLQVKGIDINQKNADGQTPLMMAKKYNLPKLVALFEAHARANGMEESSSCTIM